jgi:cytochrome c oxidase cbb3-type subunit 4
MNMDPTVVEANAFIDMGILRGGITALTMAVYAGIFWWAYRRGNRERFESDAMMPFADDESFPAAHGGDER